MLGFVEAGVCGGADDVVDEGVELLDEGVELLAEGVELVAPDGDDVPAPVDGVEELAPDGELVDGDGVGAAALDGGGEAVGAVDVVGGGASRFSQAASPKSTQMQTVTKDRARMMFSGCP